MVNQQQTPAFIAVTCQCGRGLRAKYEQAGTEVRCWDCHKMVRVPNPRQGQEVARELSDNALVVIQGPGMHLVLTAAIVITAIMSIPFAGTWLAVIAFTLAASAYGEIIFRVGQSTTEETDQGWRETLIPRSFPKFGLCVLMGAGTVIPLWILNADEHVSPHWNWLGRTIAATTWIVMPVLMLIVYGRSQDEPIGARKCLRLLARHPFATLLALSLVQMTLVLLEVVLGLVFYIPGDLVFYTLDYMPMPKSAGQPILSEGIIYFRMIDFRFHEQTQFVNAYGDGLRNGYSFVAAIPASLAQSTRAGMNGEPLGLTIPAAYTAVRVFISLVVVTCLLTAFAIQARWLGALLVVGKKRPG